MTPKQEMATERRRWPNECEYARLDSVAMAIKARNNLKLALPRISDAESLKYIFEAVECLREIEMKLTLARGEMK